MITIQTWKVDVSDNMSYKYMRCKQYDNLSRKYRIFITDRGVPVDLVGDEVITMRMWNANETKPYINKVCDWEDNMPVVVLTSGMLSKIGVIEVDFTIYSPTNHSSISTGTQHIEVQKSLIDYNGLIKSEEFGVLEHLINQTIEMSELYDDFKNNEREINQLITKITSDIEKYSSDFSNLTTKYETLFNSIVTKINEDLSQNQAKFDQLNIDVTDLKNTITDWYVTAQESENTRLSNEQVRIENENIRIRDTTFALKSCSTATQNATTAGNFANEQGDYARTQADRVDNVIRDLETARFTLDGGNLSDIEDPNADIYDGGSL